jgi:hypothetical protein
LSIKSQIAVITTVLAILICQEPWAAVEGSSTLVATSHSAGTPSVAAAASAGAQLPVSESLQEVTVTAHRIELEQRVSKFVNNIAAVEIGEGLPLWHRPVCPLVWGLAPQEDAFIVERVSMIARAAGVQLAGERCRSNLFIFVTTQPKELLQAMERRNFKYNFGDDAYPLAVDELIATPRAARVWYTSYKRTPDGLPAGFVVRIQDNPSPLSLHVVRWIAHVYVVVDQNRLQAVTHGQLADYVALAGLAQLKPGARLGDAPTILKLFDEDPKAAPSGMTEWDQAFLKSLYATEQSSTLQRSQIAHQMVSKLKP